MTSLPRIVVAAAAAEGRPLGRCEACKGGAHLKCPDRASLLRYLKALNKPFDARRPVALGRAPALPANCACLAQPCHPQGGFAL